MNVSRKDKTGSASRLHKTLRTSGREKNKDEHVPSNKKTIFRDSTRKMKRRNTDSDDERDEQPGSEDENNERKSHSDKKRSKREKPNYIERFREIQKDEKGNKLLLQDYIRWFTLAAGRKKIDEATILSKNKFDDRLDVIMKICWSQAWGANFRKAIKIYPEFIEKVARSRLVGGDYRHLEKCGVCNRENHPWSVMVKLKGKPYDRESYRARVKEEGESVQDVPVKYYMGRFCHARTKLFHHQCHFGHTVYNKCKKMLKWYGRDKDKIDKVATDKTLFREMNNELKKLIRETDNGYIKNGKRANNRWTKEHELQKLIRNRISLA